MYFTLRIIKSERFIHDYICIKVEGYIAVHWDSLQCLHSIVHMLSPLSFRLLPLTPKTNPLALFSHAGHASSLPGHPPCDLCVRWWHCVEMEVCQTLAYMLALTCSRLSHPAVCVNSSLCFVLNNVILLKYTTLSTPKLKGI